MDKAKLNKLSKVKLEEFARSEGIELDRRKTKSNMIEDYLNAKSNSETPTPAETTSAKKKYNTIEVKTQEDVAKEKADAEQAVVAKGQLAEFEKFISGIKSSDVPNPTMWMLTTLGKFVQGHKVKCTKDPETGVVSIESEGPFINGTFVLK